MKRGSEPHKYLGESVLTEGTALRCPSGHRRVKEVTSGGGPVGGGRGPMRQDLAGTRKENVGAVLSGVGGLRSWTVT